MLCVCVAFLFKLPPAQPSHAHTSLPAFTSFTHTHTHPHTTHLHTHTPTPHTPHTHTHTHTLPKLTRSARQRCSSPLVSLLPASLPWQLHFPASSLETHVPRLPRQRSTRHRTLRSCRRWSSRSPACGSGWLLRSRLTPFAVDSSQRRGCVMHTHT